MDKHLWWWIGGGTALAALVGGGIYWYVRQQANTQVQPGGSAIPTSVALGTTSSSTTTPALPSTVGKQPSYPLSIPSTFTMTPALSASQLQAATNLSSVLLNGVTISVFDEGPGNNKFWQYLQTQGADFVKAELAAALQTHEVNSYILAAGVQMGIINATSSASPTNSTTSTISTVPSSSSTHPSVPVSTAPSCPSVLLASSPLTDPFTVYLQNYSVAGHGVSPGCPLSIWQVLADQQTGAYWYLVMVSGPPTQSNVLSILQGLGWKVQSVALVNSRLSVGSNYQVIVPAY